MHIANEMIPSLWYENKDGEKWIPPADYAGRTPPPDGFIYQHSQFPCVLHHNILRLIVEVEVEACEHPKGDIVPTGGWIDGIEGRRCTRCGGHQTRKEGAPWPETWDADGCVQLARGESSWPQDLALAMANSGKWSLSEAILVAANACERCMNALAHEYGLDWGYPEGSPDWEKCGTSCQFCT
jgi:hypothetical protein